MAHFSPKLWTPPIWYGSRNSNGSRRLCTLIKWGFVAPLEQARASDFEIAISRFESCRPSQPFLPFGQASQETREWAGNPSFSRIRFRLWTFALPSWRWKSTKVSGLLREYSRFGETMGGDRFDHDCRPTEAVRFLTDKLTKAEPERRWRSRPQVHAPAKESERQR
jgi:hypothetical protein